MLKPSPHLQRTQAEQPNTSMHSLLNRRTWGICVSLMLAASLWAMGGINPAWASNMPSHQSATQAQHQLRLAGEGKMRFLGLRIYDARLWVSSEFDAQQFAQHPLALELTYHRAFKREDIANRSVLEMGRQRALTPEQAKSWAQTLAKWLPDVQAGDRLTGRYLPGQGMRLWHGSQALGELNDPELARLFFGIWLSPQTSDPSLRQALLSKTNPRTP